MAWLASGQIMPGDQRFMKTLSGAGPAIFCARFALNAGLFCHCIRVLFGAGACLPLKIGTAHPLNCEAYISWALAICFRLLRHCTIFACRRAPLSDGNRMLIRTAMMPITTRSSTNVNPGRRRVEVRISTS
jgi:hypothetical protein